MKKIIILLFVLLPVFSASAQFSEFSISGSDNYSLSLPVTNPQEIDYVFIINGISNTTELVYNNWSTAAAINWYTFSNPNVSFASGVNYIYPENATGYIAEINGVRKYVWIIDYQLYTPELIEFEPVFEQSTCEHTTLRLNQNAVPLMTYYAYGNPTPRHIRRDFTITYNSKEYGDGAWNVVEKIVTDTFPNPRMNVPASLEPNVKFTLSGDQFAERFAINPKFEISSTQSAITSIESRLTAFVTVRDALNEIERPKENEPAPPITGSAPIEILFESRPSDEGAMIEWQIFYENSTSPLVTRTDKNHRYRFSTPGKYDVKLSVTNGDCSYADSAIIIVRESLLEVPNVFTPNGDGKNDEFRVVYRSLASFHCWIYNNWGQPVYEFTDPARGWNGRIGNKNAPTGTYFYIIKAKGTDGVVYNLKGDVSIIR